MEINFKEIYLNWLHENIEQYKIGENIYRISFPYIDRNNDCIEIYIKIQQDGSYLLTDDGETINELEFSGFDIFSSSKRKTVLHRILNSHGVSLHNNRELVISCSKNELPIKKHMLTQCIIKISDLFYLARPNVQSLFIEDVRNFLEKNDIRCMPDVSFTGKSGLTTNYDFAIPKSKNAPERIIKVVNNLDNSQAVTITFLWGDTKEVRPLESSLYVFVHDNNKKVPKSAISVMGNYGINTIIWSAKEKCINALQL